MEVMTKTDATMLLSGSMQGVAGSKDLGLLFQSMLVEQIFKIHKIRWSSFCYVRVTDDQRIFLLRGRECQDWLGVRI